MYCGFCCGFCVCGYFYGLNCKKKSARNTANKFTKIKKYNLLKSPLFLPDSFFLLPPSSAAVRRPLTRNRNPPPASASPCSLRRPLPPPPYPHLHTRTHTNTRGSSVGLLLLRPSTSLRRPQPINLAKDSRKQGDFFFFFFFIFISL